MAPFACGGTISDISDSIMRRVADVFRIPDHMLLGRPPSVNVVVRAFREPCTDDMRTMIEDVERVEPLPRSLMERVMAITVRESVRQGVIR